MTRDSELDAWREHWQARDTVPPELRRRVERSVRAGRYALLAQIAVIVLFGGSTLAWAVLSGGRDALALAAGTWAFIAITVLTSLALQRRRGHGRVPEAATTTAFLDFTIQVCRGKRAAIAAAAALYPIFLAFMLVWRYQTAPFAGVGAYLLSGRVLLIAAVTLVLGIVGLRKHRDLGAELENLRAMQRELGRASPRRSC